MDRLTKRANAKINLTLDLTSVLPDGYHAIHTVMQSVSLCDDVTVALTQTEGVAFFCDAPDVPTDERNTAYRAALLFCSELGVTPFLRIGVCKRIPRQAGLGGGSADAAAVLRALNEIYGAPIPERRLLELALRIGADVPFCAVGGAALCLNKGEIMAPLPPFQASVLLVKPGTGVSTAEAYRRFDEEAAPLRPNNDAALFSFAQGDYRTGLRSALNVFEQVTDVPGGDAIKETLLRSGAYHAAMSGSGSAYFGIFDTAEAADRAAAAFAGRKELFVCRCETAAHGVEPAAGV